MIHVHNGDVVAALARRSVIPGEHVAWRESLVTGPVVPGEAWIETRARALADRYDEDLLRVRTDLLEQEQFLDHAGEQGEVVLWFEHDLFCLLHVIYLLQRISAERLSLVWSPTPLGEQDEGALYPLFESRAAVSPSMLHLARDAWGAYTSPDPMSLNQWVGRDWPDFPFLREGLVLHASRFPSTRDGLGAIEQLALELIASGTSDFVSLFDAINERMPRLGFGDTEVFRIVRAMSACAVPLVTASGTAPKAIFGITPAGMNVLGAEVDNLAVNDPDLWLGGTYLTKENVWRWDGTRLTDASP